eukprot:CAMPEP_0117684706 /NCGR_PEP_ID=MMETSP0804-20121206/21271_1 /TAXON_ID=1074897 /ORGANISM="Tetraselmis astigmatica, Strain CCMP880" /LENGTH=184 /DNA_ID=CAMNT_0005495773 /DNA_START=11 /DNA_END=561 /DNA_ORIENTATION=+
MKANCNLVLEGDKAVLVPYREEHVAAYHKWMTDPFLQETTASEPLTLEEEYEMQRSWTSDEDKCTFIVLDKSSPGGHPHGGAMAGDTNLFFNDPDNHRMAELEVMIAEASSRGKGLGREAVTMMMAYGATRLSVETFVVKIGEANAPSLSLFGTLGFEEVSRSEVFKEVTMQLQVGEKAGQWLS